MKTGFGIVESKDTTADMIDLLDRFMKSSIKIAIEYSKRAHRDNLSSLDTIYALQYNARMFSSLYTHPLSDEDGSEEDGSEEDGSEEDGSEEDCNEEDCCEEFTRADDGTEFVNLVNSCHDTWDSWVPESDVEIILKRAVNQAMSSNC